MSLFYIKYYTDNYVLTHLYVYTYFMCKYMKNNRKNLIYRISSYITIFSPIIGSGFPSNFPFLHSFRHNFHLSRHLCCDCVFKYRNKYIFLYKFSLHCTLGIITSSNRKRPKLYTVKKKVETLTGHVFSLKLFKTLFLTYPWFSNCFSII